jgi:hypothetical protein
MIFFMRNSAGHGEYQITNGSMRGACRWMLVAALRIDPRIKAVK